MDATSLGGFLGGYTPQMLHCIQIKFTLRVQLSNCPYIKHAHLNCCLQAKQCLHTEALAASSFVSKHALPWPPQHHTNMCECSCLCACFHNQVVKSIREAAKRGDQASVRVSDRCAGRWTHKLFSWPHLHSPHQLRGCWNISKGRQRYITL